MPTSLGNAVTSGVPVQEGLYAAVIACPVYPIFATGRSLRERIRELTADIEPAVTAVILTWRVQISSTLRVRTRSIVK